MSTVLIIAYNNKSMRDYWLNPLVFLLLALPPPLNAASPSPSPAVPVRFLVPNTAHTLEAQPVLAGIIEEYNRAHPQAPVSLIRRGEEYSSIQELIATELAGSTPELATLEYTEIPAISELNLVKKEYPFTRVSPVLLVNEEALFRVNSREVSKNWPPSWQQLLVVANKLANGSSTRNRAGKYALAIPLQGARGLWIFEALARKPLWQRQAGGLRANRELTESIHAIQKLLDTPHLVRPELSLDRAVQDFLERKTSLLVASIDLLPYVRKNAQFRWKSTPLPCPGQNSPCSLQGGSNLITTSEKPAVQDFLAYWFSPEITGRWSEALGVLPASKMKKAETRSTDPDVIRARSAWVQALPLFFGEASKRLASENVFLQLDRALNQNK
ncbi:MAG: hypothetical protein A2070_03865 [Bdellovibrionales bacterium GWC1_52_8]|nr:MAG: hypothetical protein A2070_03865 [Bdellovibrionales bacterium GWC1_52_8]